MTWRLTLPQLVQFKIKPKVSWREERMKNVKRLHSSSSSSSGKMIRRFVKFCSGDEKKTKRIQRHCFQLRFQLLVNLGENPSCFVGLQNPDD